jgi:hypothetical protein
MAGNALEEAQRVGDGLFEMSGSIERIETRMLAGFRMLGIDVLKRLAEEEAARAAKKAAHLPPELPPARDRSPSQVDEMERAARAAGQLADNLEDLRDKSSPGFTNPLARPSKPSDPAEAAKKVAWGVVLIVFRTARDLAIEHWVRVAWLAAFALGSGVVTHYLTRWGIWK